MLVRKSFHPCEAHRTVAHVLERRHRIARVGYEKVVGVYIPVMVNRNHIDIGIAGVATFDRCLAHRPFLPDIRAPVEAETVGDAAIQIDNMLPCRDESRLIARRRPRLPRTVELPKAAHVDPVNARFARQHGIGLLRQFGVVITIGNSGEITHRTGVHPRDRPAQCSVERGLRILPADIANRRPHVA